MSKTLGRGLGSLIPQKRVSTEFKNEGEGVARYSSFKKESDVLEIEIEKIKPNSRQPRKNFPEESLNELSASIKEYGVIQPIVVQRSGNDYELIVGERRLRASKMAGLKKIPAIIRNYTEQKKLEVALVENLQREDLNPIEKAMAYRQLLDEFNLTQEALSKKVGKSRPMVTNALRLLNLPENIREGLASGSISESNGYYLAGVEDEQKRNELFKKIKENKWTSAETLKQIRKIGGTKQARIKNNYLDREKEDVLRKFFGTRVEIKRENRGGKVIINFYSEDELDGIVKKVKNA